MTKLFHVSVLVPDKVLFDVLEALAANRCGTPDIRPVVERVPVLDGALNGHAKPRRNTKNPGNVHKSEVMGEWVMNWLKGKTEFASRDLANDMRAAQLGAPNAVYGQLERARQAKLIKKIKPGQYKVIA